MYEQLKLCKEIAHRAHYLQYRRNGDNYIIHPGRVANQFHGFEACVAWLHDVLEDCDVTDKDLLYAGVAPDIVDCVKLLTKSKGQSYWDYLANVATDHSACLVKIADMVDNLCDEPTDSQKKKYRDSIMRLVVSLTRENEWSQRTIEFYHKCNNKER